MNRGGYRGNKYNPYSNYSRPNARVVSKAHSIPEPCVIYTRTGRCDQRKTCRYQHDPKRRALCLQFLKTGRCSKTGAERCFLSHEPQQQNTPLCSHFARGHCNKTDCKFLHMNNLGENPYNAPICRSFALNGWCDRGLRCTKRHCFDCPDFDAHGSCANQKCILEHVIKEQPPKQIFTPREAKTLVNVDVFLDFLKHADREVFDANIEHTTTQTNSTHGNEAESNGEYSESEEEDSDSGVDWQEDEDKLDINADFIKV